ncbi:uncharacterized protein M437DRAFT_88686 [Aureobasidium melanogenum CBS 110374]|uniref:Aminoglycoside phosphotransferase domain-containing protein n=1 Tax=Aureobasidium melanogenum (strain CBS 110374) TaxID=1043003 RepID=A0A074VL51_AURM1|nr:uncharacterized protein M437DRAFT_88686 [Aureobasidium melanogenum CBS 110374]KEQ58377.1 hypothetical protein M437DRAFT_88686 [Aureobasidium melanogenum CBS 110374]
MPLPQSMSTKASKLDSKIIWNPPIPTIDLTEVHQTISLHGLLAVASQLRDGKECDFALETDTKPISGGQCIIFVVEYSDGIKYAFRLPYHTRKSTIRDSFFAHELETWKALISNRIPLIPKIFGFGLSDDNLIGFPFIAYEWVEGKPLVWTDNEPCDPTHREKTIKTLASFTIETACRMQKPGKTSAEVYVTEAIDRKIKRVLNGTLRTAKLIDCLRQRSLIHKYLIPQLNDSPWVMVHGDLSNSNIIEDPEHDISGLNHRLWVC